MQKDNKSLTVDERMSLEDSIMDAHMAADKFLTSGREVHVRLLELSVSDALEYIQKYKNKLTDDPKSENYKLHMMIPLQLHLMIEDEKDAKKT
tara:strand:- start:7263 stop:7541 length:279 start_codon:yes stop_codon:yes gene_type:complete